MATKKRGTKPAPVPPPLTTDRLWEIEDVMRFFGAKSKQTIYDMPGLPRIEIPGSGKRPILRFDPQAVWEYARNHAKKGAA